MKYQVVINKTLLLWIAILCFISVCIETELYVPAFPQILSHFSSTERKLELLLSFNCLGLAISSLIYGALSDAFGRKKMLLIGLTLFLIGCIGCLFSQSIDQLIGCRLVQGLGAGAIFCILPASFFDITSAQEGTRLLSFLNAIITGAMAAAPILGTCLNTYFGWLANFVVVTSLVAVSLVVTAFFYKETLPHSNRISFSLFSLFKNYAKLMGSFNFIANTLIFSLFYCANLVYIANLSLIFINYLGVSPEPYSLHQASIFGVYMIFSFAAARFIAKQGLENTKNIGLRVIALGAVALGIVAILAPSNPLLITLSMVTFSAGTALSMNIFYGYAVSSQQEVKGAANALAGSIRMALNAILIGISGLIFTGSIKPVILLILLSTLLCFTLAFVLTKQAKLARQIAQ